MLRRWLALWCWTYVAWVLLTWTRTAEQLIFGAAASALVAVACAPLGDVAEPWRLLHPRRVVLIIRLGAHVAINIVRANLSLSRRIWSPSRPVRPGMVVVTTNATSEASLTAVGLLTSLIVDNQLVDVDRARSELLYHAVWVDSEDPERNRSQMNGPLEGWLRLTEERS